MQNDYFAKEALSASGAKAILRSPAHYKHWKDNPKEPTPAMVFGTLVHSMVLEPHKSIYDVVSIKQMNWTTKEGKAEREELQKIGLPIVSQQDADRAFRVRDAVWLHPHAKEMLQGVQTEKTYEWTGYDAKVACKGGIDAIGSAGILDIKTTLDASPNSFAKTIRAFNYHMQAAHYLDAVQHVDGKLSTFTFIAVETQAPYAVGIYRLDHNSLRAGWQQMNRIAKIYADCIATNQWPAYPLEPLTLEVPYIEAQAEDEGVDAEEF